MDVRIENALYALCVVIMLQMAMMIVGFVLKKNMPSMPLVEIILRPFLIGLIDRLNRKGRSQFALIFRGAIIVLIMGTIFTLFIVLIQKGMMWAGYPQWTHILLLFLILSPIMVLQSAYAVSVDKPMDGAYLNIARSLNQNLIPADKHGLRRAGCKAMALGLCEWVIAPILFYILGGIICTYIYVALSLFVRLSSHEKTLTSLFRYVYVAMYCVVFCLGVIMVFISSLFSAGGKPLKIFNAFQISSMMVEAAIAYTQNITLGGVYQTRLGESVKLPWIGADGATAKLEHRDVLRVIIQYGITVFLILVMLLALVIY